MNGAFAPKMYEFESRSFMALMSILQMGPHARFCNPGGRGADLFALLDRDEIAARRADVELPRPPDLVLRVGDHLVPLRDPADRAREREDAGEHRHGNSERALHDARVEVHVGIELARDEVVVLEGDLLQRD